jgi:hypothetical protein
MTESQPMPPDPMTAAGNALAAGAQNAAQNAVMRRVRTQLKGYLPRFLWPLIPGERGTVAGAVKKDVKKRVAAAISGLLFSLFFFAAFGAVILFVLGIIGWALFTSM